MLGVRRIEQEEIVKATPQGQTVEHCYLSASESIDFEVAGEEQTVGPRQMRLQNASRCLEESSTFQIQSDGPESCLL